MPLHSDLLLPTSYRAYLLSLSATRRTLAADARAAPLDSMRGTPRFIVSTPHATPANINARRCKGTRRALHTTYHFGYNNIFINRSSLADCTILVSRATLVPLCLQFSSACLILSHLLFSISVPPRLLISLFF